MHQKMKSRICSSVMVLAICISMLSVAEPSALAYSDVNSSAVEEAVTILSDLGIISGYSDGTFRPDQTLTRAEFSKLAIYAEGKEDKISSNAYRSYFNDIATSHWALGCINLAYSEGLISGYGDGTFGPDDDVTCGQAVTIVLRLLGYSSDDIGTFWPQDYINKATDLGLLDGVDADANDPLTRGDAALMLYAMIQQDTATGEDYISALVSSTVDSVLLLDNDAEADDASTGNALVYVNGNLSYYVQENKLSDSLIETYVTLLLNDSGDVIGSLPEDESTVSKLVTVSATAATKITDQSGNKYTIAGNTAVIYQGELTTYANCYEELATQGSVKLYYNSSGGSVNLVVTTNVVEDSVAIATGTSKFANYFENKFELTSGSYTIYKNGIVVSSDELERYDVAVYDKATRSLLVSNNKLTGFIEDISPNAMSATSITVLGTTFLVLESAQNDLAAYNVGEEVTLLLTADGQVAAAYDPDDLTAAMTGVLDSTSTNSGDDTVANITLTNGIEISAVLSNPSDTDLLVGTLVNVNPSAQGVIYVSSYKGSATKSDLNVLSQTLGTIELSSDVKIYDQVGAGYVVAVTLDDIKVDTVTADQIKYINVNSAGKVDIILLDDVTGNCYTYGFFVVGSESSGSGTMQTTNRTVAVEYGTNLTTTAYITGNSATDGEIGGVAGSGSGKAVAIATLTEETVALSAFDGTDNIKIDGVSVPISEDVVVYNAATGNWTTLSAAKAFTNSFTVYYDRTPETGGQIRVVIANQ